jgi:hypothetical protein|eukprot:COSAG06_NODE_5711_length_3310_cov_1.642790_2_plen_214_part_00
MDSKVAMGVAAAGAAAATAVVCGVGPCAAAEESPAAATGVVHIYRSPGLSPPKVVSVARTCAQFGIAEAAITTVRVARHLRGVTLGRRRPWLTACSRSFACYAAVLVDAGGVLQRDRQRRRQPRVRVQRRAPRLLSARDLRSFGILAGIVPREEGRRFGQGGVGSGAGTAPELHHSVVHERRVHPARIRRVDDPAHRGSCPLSSLPLDRVAES